MDAYQSSFFGPYDLFGQSTKYTLVSPVTGARVYSPCEWNSHLPSSADSRLITAEDIMRLTFPKNFFEWILSSVGNYSENNSIFPDHDYSRNGELFFANDGSRETEIKALGDYWKEFRTPEAVVQIIKCMISHAEANADICMLTLNLKQMIPPGYFLNRLFRLCFTALNYTEYVQEKFENGINVQVTTQKGGLNFLTFRTYPWFPTSQMRQFQDCNQEYHPGMQFRPVFACETAPADLPAIIVFYQHIERIM